MIIGLNGVLRSGKDTIGNILVKNHGFNRVAFADELKNIVSKSTNTPLNYFHDDNLKDTKLDTPFVTTISFFVTFFEEIQKALGNDHTFDTDIAAMTAYNDVGDVELESPRRLLQYLGTDIARRYVNDDVWLKIAIRKVKAINGHVVVTDCRFVNEIEAVKAIGGKAVKVRRPGFTGNGHASEQEISDELFTTIITNDSNLSTLEHNVNLWVQHKLKQLGDR
jgi:hypothetical protein